MLTVPLEPEDEDDELDELLELEELLDDDDEEEDDEELLNPDEEEELLELELEDDVGVVSPPPHAAKLSASRHELAIVTGRCQPTSVFIEDIFTYLFLVNTHCELEVFFRYKLFVIVVA